MVDRLTRIYYQGRYFYYPLQLADVLVKLGPINAARCLASYAKEKLAPSFPQDQQLLVRIVGRKPVRPPTVRDVFQVLQRKTVGHIVY